MACIEGREGFRFREMWLAWLVGEGAGAVQTEDLFKLGGASALSGRRCHA